MKHATVSGAIISSAIEVHSQLGPGLLESAYEECLAYEFGKSGLSYERQVPIPLEYKEIRLNHGYRLDFLVEEVVIIEVKAVEALNPVHEAQILTYLRFAKKDVGLLINFHVMRLREGIRRFVL